MIIVDTNVLSEGLKPKPPDRVLRWLAAQEHSTVYTSTITQAELFHGVEALPPGRRRAGLLAAIEKILGEEFDGRILPFDEDAARAFSTIVVTREAARRPISQFDAMIAAIARSHRAAVATRNTADFDGCGIQAIDPWAE